MKNSISTFLLCCIIFGTVSSQRPWVAAGTEWQLINYQNSPTLPVPYYAVCADTVLKHGIWCSEIMPFPPSCSPMSGQKQYLYEQDKRVYFEYQGNFYLIFDHNKVEGESYMTHFININLKLDSALVTIDSVFTTSGSCPARVQKPVQQPSALNCNYSDWIVEGRGYIRTIFPEYKGCDPLTQAVQCFFAPGTCNEVPCIVPTADPTEPSAELIISPNPGSDLLTFLIPITGNLAITDLAGVVWHQAKAQLLSEVSVRHLPAGVYYIVLEEVDKPIKSVKWVKIGN
jgi:hypothetical protein